MADDDDDAKKGTHVNQFHITLSSFISYTGKMGVPLFAVLSNHSAIVEWVLSVNGKCYQLSQKRKQLELNVSYVETHFVS